MSSDVKKLICKCCGAPLNPKTLVCEYCGTPHKRDDNRLERDCLDSVIRVETFQQPVRKFTAYHRLHSHQVYVDPQEASRLAMERIANAMAHDLIKMMEFKTSRDPITSDVLVRGTLKVVEPEANYQEGSEWCVERPW